MKRETIYEIESLYRSPFKIESFSFGAKQDSSKCKRSVAVMGSMRGNEVQQLYIASQVIHNLRQLEDAGLIADDVNIRIIPCANPFSINTGSRFWAMDNTDINRMFPGYYRGETAQRIAHGIFSVLKDYDYGIQLASFYLPGEFVPHVRMMDTGTENAELVKAFGLPYAVIKRPDPVDSGTLNYNWQIWDTRAVSLYSRETSKIDVQTAETIVFAILRFMTRYGFITYNLHGGSTTTIVKEEHLVNIRTSHSGLVNLIANPGDHVSVDQKIATIYDPLTGDVLSKVRSPVTGVVFFSSSKPLVCQDTILYRIIDDRPIES